MEHEHALAKAAGTYFEARAVAGKRIVPVNPVAGIVRLRVIRAVLTVVENDFEHPLGAGQVRVGHTRRSVPVTNVFGIEAGTNRAVPLVGPRLAHSDPVFTLVFVYNRVALVVVTLRDQPGKVFAVVGRIGDARVFKFFHRMW